MMLLKHVAGTLFLVRAQYYINKLPRVRKTIFLFASLLAVVGSIDASELVYVYVDGKGKTIMQDIVTDEARHYGYKIVNANGVTLQTVPPNRDIERNNAGGYNGKILGSSDWMLLQNYTRVEEIVNAKTRRLESVQALIDGSENNLRVFTKNLDDLKSHRREIGDKAPTISKVDKDINDTEANIEILRKHVTQLRADYTQTSSRYDADIKRFKELQKNLATKNSAR